MNPKYILPTAFIIMAVAFFHSCKPEQKEKDFSAQEKIFNTTCSGCHGGQMQAFVDRKWKFGNSREELIQTITNGNAEVGMPVFGQTFSPEQIADLADYIRHGIENVEKYRFDAVLKSDTFETEQFSFHLDTVFTGADVPWGLTFLPNNALLITDRSGAIFHLSAEGDSTLVTGGPEVLESGQGGLLDVEVHPDYKKNGWIYMSYSAFKEEGGQTLSSTAVDRMKLSDSLTIYDRERIFEALPYSTKRHHYGSRLEFDRKGYLFVSVGDRGNRDENPQSLQSFCGKIHKIYDDGRIPEDNPFIDQENAVGSIYSYGHRNPQGMDLHPTTGKIWTHEHGPRGGDEINIINAGLNYGWPVISYGLNYDGTIFTNLLEKEGMEQPVLYWVPSIAPSGMTFVTSDKYPGWEGNLLSGSLRFKYVNICHLEGDKITEEKTLMENIGRVRNIKEGPDGFIYAAVERPGYIFRLVPLD